MRLLLPDVYADINGWVGVIRSSGFDWTVVRLPMLTDKDGESPPFVGYVGMPELKMFSLSRNVLAEFLLVQLTDRSLITQAPAISNRS